MAKQWKSLFEYYGFTKKDEKKYPVISRILKQLTPERIKKELMEIQKVKLPPELQKWVKEYEKVGGRNEFIWLATREITQIVTLPNIVKKYRESLLNIKFLISMFFILVDDAIDRTKKENLQNELLKIPFEKKCKELERLSAGDKKYFILTTKIWKHVKKIIKNYPRYKELRDIFQYDIFQALIAMKFAGLVNRNLYLMNTTEYWQYSPYTMQSMIYATLDLMCSPKFSIKELGTIREVAWQAQKMARIGNCLSTWEREINEKDFSSGVFAYAIESGSMAANGLRKENKLKIVNKIKNLKIEEDLLKEWEKYYWEIRKFNKKIKSININRLLFQLEKLLVIHLTVKNV